jgi:CBS domain-containing protein
MKVKDVMTTDLETCTPETTVAAAAQKMWEGDCGILPVVENGELMGVVTDRDMYVALATRDARPSRLRVGEVATTHLVSCGPEDDVLDALALMKKARVRRLPVTGFGNSLLGILSLNDILLVTGESRQIPSDVVVETLQAICGHHHPAPHVVAA